MKKRPIIKGFIYTSMTLAVICSTLMGCGGQFTAESPQISTSVVSGTAVETTKSITKFLLNLI